MNLRPSIMALLADVDLDRYRRENGIYRRNGQRLTTPEVALFGRATLQELAATGAPGRRGTAGHTWLPTVSALWWCGDEAAGQVRGSQFHAGC